MIDSWIETIASKIENDFIARNKTDKIICASGMTPAGPIHLGILRELIITNVITEELQSRGWDVEHIHFWDDFDHYCKYYESIPRLFFDEYCGMPLCDVPDPFGEYKSYAIRYISEFEKILVRIGIKPVFSYQSDEYRKGTYRKQIKQSLKERFEIFKIINRRSTIKMNKNYFPLQIYCKRCFKDFTTVIRYEEKYETVYYSCACGYLGKCNLDGEINYKLTWKVNWATRWHVHKIDFEPSGQNHFDKYGSVGISKRIIKDIFHCNGPLCLKYAFVGTSGQYKISSRSGVFCTLKTAIELVEPNILRWLFIKYEPNVNIIIDIEQGLDKIYNEWDLFVMNMLKTNSLNSDLIFLHSIKKYEPKIEHTIDIIPFKMIKRIILDNCCDLSKSIDAISSKFIFNTKDIERKLKPRIFCAYNWLDKYAPLTHRFSVRKTFNYHKYESIADEHKIYFNELVSNLDDNWNLSALTNLIYSIPKKYCENSISTKEIKKRQKDFFKSIYLMVCDRYNGPRIPKLFLMLGKAKVKKLLTYPG